jgi:serine/threonine-protein kinase
LCNADGRGGTWSEDGTIILSRSGADPLSRVSSAGGTPERFTSLDQKTGESTHRWPQILPGGKAVLFTANSSGINFEDSSLVVQMLPSGERKTVYRGGFYGRYLPSGHLIFVQEGTLFAMPFDLKRLEATGQPVPVIEQVASSGLAGGQFPPPTPAPWRMSLEQAPVGTCRFLGGAATANWRR